ncbi:porin [Algibacter sp. 2305UL17-15]|uniref:porin n=1 Tax=Algibacter sp. 2305UL17-15 TaxID=3231268 RepID=UPI0034595000
MKILKISVLLVFILSGVFAEAQIKLDTYKFGEGLNFRGDGDYNIQLSGFVQPYMETKRYTEVDENSSVSRFRMRRLRLRIDGNSGNQKFNYRFAVDLSGSTEADTETGDYLLDAFVSYNFTNRIRATFGQRSTYTDNRELFMSSNTLQLVERSRLTSAFATIREFGLFLDGRFRMGRGAYLKPYFVLTNGDGGNVFGKDHGGLKIGGRLDYLPFGLFTYFGQFRQADVVRELTPKLVVGAHYSKNNGMSSRRGRESGAILYLDANDEESLPDYTKIGVDFLFKYNGFSALGEYIKSDASVPTDITQRVRNNGTTSTNFDVDGTQDVENYVKGRMMLGEAYNFQLGYLFKSGISVDGRYTHLNADTNSFLNNATFYNRPNYYTLGVSKYLSRSYGAKIQASHTYVDGSDGINDNNGNPISGNEWITRVILTLTF